METEMTTTTDKPLSERVHLTSFTDEVPRAYYVCDDDMEYLPHEIAALERQLAEAKRQRDKWHTILIDSPIVHQKEIVRLLGENQSLRADNARLRERVAGLEGGKTTADVFFPTDEEIESWKNTPPEQAKGPRAYRSVEIDLENRTSRITRIDPDTPPENAP